MGKDDCMTQKKRLKARYALKRIILVGLLIPTLALSSNESDLKANKFLEVPFLTDQVKNGELPMINERVPKRPLVTKYSDDEASSAGEYGGTLRMLMGKGKDIRMMSVFGYARLVGYDQSLALQADILESYEMDNFKQFTFKLREGHKWSDGHPFTAEDFRFYWEDIATNTEVTPFGPPKAMLINGKPPKFEIIDELTVRYTWDEPNHYFLEALAGARPLYIYQPAHYLKQFHIDYADSDYLAKMIARTGVSRESGLVLRMGHQYKFDNVDLPVLQPWINTTELPADYFIFKRNPFYHRVDENGRQLPYIDKVTLNIVSSSLVSAKTSSGESDLQARYLKLDDYTFLKEGEKRNPYEVRLWGQAKSSQVAIYPNLTTNDPSWRPVMKDIRFRTALSLAINRKEINQVIYFGLAKESGNTVLPGSDFGNMAGNQPWINYDIKQANELLDNLGFTERNDRGLRMMPLLDESGNQVGEQPMEIIIHSAGESTEESDVLELVADSWLKIGIKLITKPSQREVFRQRVTSGQASMSVWSGLDNGLATVHNSPAEFVPSEQTQLQWPSWGNYYETDGQAGEEPDSREVSQMLRHFAKWKTAETIEQCREAWEDILEIYNKQLFSIGTVSDVPTPLVVNNYLNNVPQKGIYAWSPYAYFGAYRMDTFWFDEERRQ